VKRNIRSALDRCVLHLTKVADFAAWAVEHGYERASIKGEFEALRLKPQTGPVLIWFTRVGAVHATSATRESRLVRRWLRERGDDPGNARIAENRERPPEHMLKALRFVAGHPGTRSGSFPFGRGAFRFDAPEYKRPPFRLVTLERLIEQGLVGVTPSGKDFVPDTVAITDEGRELLESLQGEGAS
jgi:hypothetical protein